jgi:outer membrane receptor protein involved in Fe transport
VVCPESPSEGICPIVNMFQTDRLTGGLFVSGATRVLNNLSLDAGSRLQVYGGKRAVDPELLFTGGAAWTFLPRWNLKVNFLQGFRTPSMQKTDGNGEAINWQGNPDLEAEKSQSVQGEINTMLAIGQKTVKVLKVRADYSYSWVSNFVELDNGIQRNLSDIGIHAVEFLADLQMKNSHWFSLGYTFLDLNDAVRGKIRTVPAQWLNLGGFLNLWNKQLYLSTNLTVVGSMEDPNRYPAREAGTVRIGGLDDAGLPLAEQAYEAQVTDIIVDRLPPAAIWNAGIRYLMPKYKLRFSFDAYNLLDADYYEGEAMMDLSTFMQMVPLAGEGFSFFFRCQANL